MDILRAIHFDRFPSYSTTELQILLPSGNSRFDDTYLSLRHGQLQNSGLCNEDALLLVCALLSDILSVRKAFGPIFHSENPSSFTNSPKRYIPFSPLKETGRIGKDLSRALDTWHANFGDTVSSEIVSLYFFCRLLLICPDILELPKWAGYKPMMRQTDLTTGTHKIAAIDGVKISEDALKFSWLILEHVGLSSNGRADCPWIPIILFYAALVIGAKLRSVPPESAGRYGTLRSLSLFTNDLERIMWPCCQDMIAAIHLVLGCRKRM